VALFTQALLVQVCPDPHTVPQLPQFDTFEVVSMQVAGEPQSIWPAVAHAQTPLVHCDPPVQAMQLLPQAAEFVAELHTPPEHIVLPAGQLVAHAPSLQTPVEGHTAQLVPQCASFDAWHEPPHKKSPEAHTHDPFWQVVPVAQAFPQAPQFWLSVVSSTHPVRHDVRPATHAGAELPSVAGP
jgi:hypothetical protein